MSPTLTATPHLVVTATAYITPRGEAPFYEIVAQPHGDLNAKPWVFITRDETLWNAAIAVEGDAAPVAIAWHHAKRANGRGVKVAASLTRETETEQTR